MNNFNNPRTFSVSVWTTEVQLCALLPAELTDMELIVTADSLNTGTVFIGNTWLTAGTVRATDWIPVAPWKSKPYWISNPRLLYARSNSWTNIVYVEAN